MTAFMLNLVLAIVWAALVGSVDSSHLVVGFAIGYAVMALLAPLTGSQYHRKLPRVAAFAAFFLRELVASTLRVAWEVLTPARLRRPGIVSVPLEPASDAEITLLATLITLTPGTMAMDVSDDRRELFVHAMFVEDPERLRRDIKEGFERRVFTLTRSSP